MEEVPAFA